MDVKSKSTAGLAITTESFHERQSVSYKELLRFARLAGHFIILRGLINYDSVKLRDYLLIFIFLLFAVFRYCTCVALLSFIQHLI